MYKLRILALSLIIATCIPTLAVPVQAGTDISAMARIAGTSGPVLSAVTSCAIGLIGDKVIKTVAVALSKVDPTKAKVSINTTGQQADQAASANQTKFQSKCLIPMERAAAQVILNTLTTETVNWINKGGQGGGPLFMTDPSKALSDLQKSAIGDISSMMKDNSGDLPFGKAILKDTLTQLQTGFLNDSKYNLDRLAAMQNAASSHISLGVNLNNGGWSMFNGALLANNNPIGFKFKTDEYVASKLGDTNISPAALLMKKLDWGKGFLSQETCLDPKGWDNLDEAAQKATPCKEPKIVTPGSVISEKLTHALGAQQDALALGNNLDASITSIFDAMMVKLMQEGLFHLSDSTNDSNNSGPGQQDNNNLSQQATITGNATPGSACGVDTSADWYLQYPKFDILHDLSDLDAKGQPQQGLISRELALKTLLEAQNKIIKWIIRDTYQLDLCIPGPASLGDSSIKDTIFGTMMSSYNYPGSDVTQVNEAYNAQFLSDNFGIKYFPNDKIASPGQVQKIIKTLISRYYDAMVNMEYQNLNSSNIPVLPKAQAQYQKIAYYEQQSADNDAKIGLINGTVGQLRAIQTRINQLLTSQLDSNSLNFKARLKSIQGSFDVLIPDLDVAPNVPK